MKNILDLLGCNVTTYREKEILFNYKETIGGFIDEKVTLDGKIMWEINMSNTNMNILSEHFDSAEKFHLKIEQEGSYEKKTKYELVRNSKKNIAKIQISDSDEYELLIYISGESTHLKYMERGGTAFCQEYSIYPDSVTAITKFYKGLVFPTKNQKWDRVESTTLCKTSENDIDVSYSRSDINDVTPLGSDMRFSNMNIERYVADNMNVNETFHSIVNSMNAIWPFDTNIGSMILEGITLSSYLNPEISNQVK